MQHSDSTTRSVGELWSLLNEQSPLLFRARSSVIVATEAASLTAAGYFRLRPCGPLNMRMCRAKIVTARTIPYIESAAVTREAPS